MNDMSVYKPQSEGMAITDLIKSRSQDSEQEEKQVEQYSVPIKKKHKYQAVKDILEKIEEPKKVKQPKENNYLGIVVEFLIILIIYVIMSQPVVISFTSHYIKQLNPGPDGQASMNGIIIYGTIMSVIFMVVRKLLFYKLQI